MERPRAAQQVAVWGHLEAYYKVGDKLERDPREDIEFPETLSFATTGIGRGKCRNLPCHMHLRFRLLDSIFPRVPSAATNERSQQKREFMVQTTYGGIATGYDSTIVGTVDIVQRASGNTATLVENYAGSNDDGTQKVNYAAQQTGSFDSSGVLQRSQTSFEFNWRSKDRVDISVTQIPADQVIAAFSLAEP